MASHGYIIMIIVDSCMIWSHFDCIMQLKNSYHIATNVCSRKSATTFGDIPDCLWNIEAHCPFILFEIITRMIEFYVRIAGVLGI